MKDPQFFKKVSKEEAEAESAELLVFDGEDSLAHIYTYQGERVFSVFSTEHLNTNPVGETKLQELPYQF